MFDLSVWNEEAGCFTLETGSYDFYLGTDCENRIAGCSANVTVTADITPAMKTVTLTPSAIVMNVGDTNETEVSVSLVNDLLYASKAAIPADIALTYASSNEAVATVDANGCITAVGAGTCTITVTATMNGNVATGSHAVAVK